jgi:integrase
MLAAIVAIAGNRGSCAMSRHPGFAYNASTKCARFDCYVPGTSGRLRRRRTVIAQDRAEALRLWREFVEEIAVQPEAIPQPDDHTPVKATIAPTLREFIESHYDTIAAGFKPSTRRTQANIIKKRLLPVFGEVKLDAISAVSVADFKVALRNDGFAPTYINDLVRVLKMLLHQAVERDVIAIYPIRKKVPKEREPILRLEMSDDERATFLSVFDDFKRFAKHVGSKGKTSRVIQAQHLGGERRFGRARSDGPALRRSFARFQWMKPFFACALETGLRKGDLRKLEWSAVDVVSGWIKVTMQKTRFEATIPISAACAGALDQCRRRAVISAFVFVDEKGHPLPEIRIRRTFVLAKKLAGITRRCRFHDLRHTFASRLVSRGVNLRVVATALGHTTTEQTERYAKPSEAAMRQIKTALDA